jgi:hypothetical protein
LIVTRGLVHRSAEQYPDEQCRRCDGTACQRETHFTPTPEGSCRRGQCWFGRDTQYRRLLFSDLGQDARPQSSGRASGVHLTQFGSKPAQAAQFLTAFLAGIEMRLNTRTVRGGEFSVQIRL